MGLQGPDQVAEAGGHLVRELVVGVPARLQDLRRVEAEQAASHPRLVVRLHPVPETAGDADRAAGDLDLQGRLLQDLAGDAVLQPFARVDVPARQAPRAVRRPQPVPQQQDASLLVPDDPARVDQERRVPQPGEPPLHPAAEPFPRPRDHPVDQRPDAPARPRRGRPEPHCRNASGPGRCGARHIGVRSGSFGTPRVVPQGEGRTTPGGDVTATATRRAETETPPEPPPRRRATVRVLRKIAVTVAGTVLIVAGVAMLVLPGPGIVSILAGLGLLGTEFPTARRVSERVRACALAAWRAVRTRTARARGAARTAAPRE